MLKPVIESFDTSYPTERSSLTLGHSLFLFANMKTALFIYVFIFFTFYEGVGLS